KDYLAVHQAKEALYWQNYMGLGGEDIAQQFSTAETVYKRFIAQSHRLKELRDLIAQLESEPTAAGRDELLQGWYRFFDCNAIEDPNTQALLDAIIAAESSLYQRRKTSL
ncbi:TPA: peptidase, partial [Yersinia enterocolitica]|nr:peptidase [Yersinia enterocolitica]